MADTTPDWAKDEVVIPDWAQEKPNKEVVPHAHASHKDQTTFIERVNTGIADPLYGAAQIAERLNPFAAAQQFMGGNPKRLTSELIHEREAAYKQKRGESADNLDIGRMAGNMLNPINWIGGPAIKGGRALAGAATGAAAGALGAAAAPINDGGGYWANKVEQTGIGTVLGGVIGTGSKVAEKGLDKLGEWLVRNHPEALENKAVQTILRRVKQDEKAGSPTAQDMLDLVQQSNKPMSIADVSGRNVKALAGNVARQPGESSAIVTKFLNDRDRMASDRLQQDIDKYIFSGDTAHQATKGLLTARSAASKRPYDEFHELQGIWSPRLQEFIDDPDVKQGMSHGWAIERKRALAEGRPITASQLGADVDSEGNIMMLSVPNTRLLDMAKRGLDKMVEDSRNPITGRLSAEGVALNQMRRAYVAEIDALDRGGVYRRARQTWEGPSASMDAIKLGRSIFTMNPEESAAELKEMSLQNQEFYRLGAADMVMERLLKSGLSSDESKAIIRSPWMKMQLRSVFKTQQDFDSFASAVENERAMHATKQGALGGSPTQERLTEERDNIYTAMHAGRSMTELVLGRPIAAAVSAWRLYRDLGLRQDPKFNEVIAKILFSTPVPGSQTSEKLAGRLSSKTQLPTDSITGVMPKATPAIAGGLSETAARNWSN